MPSVVLDAGIHHCIALACPQAILNTCDVLCRSFNSILDYPTRGESYEIQHEDFHNTDRPNTFLAYGALVGGPGAEDT